MANIAGIKAEIDTDPLTRGYAGMTDAQVAADLMTAYREGPGSATAIRQYLSHETSRSNDGSDTVVTFIIQRLAQVAAMTPTTDGSDQTDPFGGTTLITNKMISAAVALQSIAVDNEFETPHSDSRLDTILSLLVSATVFKSADKTAILALTENTMTRAAELGLGKVEQGHVEESRAL